MDRTDLKIDTPTAREGSRPVLYELIGKDGRKRGHYGTAQAAANAAAHFFPDQQQDPDRSGKGWDIQAVR